MGHSGKSSEASLNCENNNNINNNKNKPSMPQDLQNMMCNILNTYTERFDTIEKSLKKLESKVDHLGERVSDLNR